jgi:hypothetical protein
MTAERDEAGFCCNSSNVRFGTRQGFGCSADIWNAVTFRSWQAVIPTKNLWRVAALKYTGKTNQFFMGRNATSNTPEDGQGQNIASDGWLQVHTRATVFRPRKHIQLL